MLPGLEHLRRKEVDEQVGRRENQRQHHRRAEVQRAVKAVAAKEAQIVHHGDLLRAHAVSLDDDVLILLVDGGLHGVIRLLAVLLRRRLVDQHVRPQARAQRRDSDVVPQIGARVVGDDLLDVVDRVIDLALGDGGYQRRACGRGHALIQRLKIVLGRAHQRAKLIIAQLEAGEHALRLAVILVGEGRVQIRPAALNLRAQLAHGAQLGKRRVQIRQNGVRDGVVLVVYRRNRVGRLLTASACRDFIDDVAAGRDRLGRDVAHAQVVLLGRNGQKADQQQHQIRHHRKERLLHANAQAVNPRRAFLRHIVH